MCSRVCVCDATFLLYFVHDIRSKIVGGARRRMYSPMQETNSVLRITVFLDLFHRLGKREHDDSENGSVSETSFSSIF
jgi:hypothetical protein